MKVLVACEFSGIVRDAFIKHGHDAWSCDLIPAESNPDRHFQLDVRRLINRQDYYEWDIMIAHPPCTYLAASGARYWKYRQKEQEEAVKFFFDLVRAPIPRICIENPVSIMSTEYRKPDQYIQPWQFGHGETKKTGLWLKGLPLLKPTQIVDGRDPRVYRLSPSPDRWKHRSRTLPGIADAMANQWGSLEGGDGDG